MMDLARIDLATMTVVPDEAPGAARIQAVLPPDTWADLTERGYPGVGYWPIVDVAATYDPMTQELGSAILTADQAGKRVTRTPAVVDLTLDQAKAAKLAALDARRLQLETGGYTVAGVTIATTDRAKMLLGNACEKAKSDSTLTVQWPDASGAFHTLDATTIIAIWTAISNHVAALYAYQSKLAAQINAAADLAALRAIDITAGWPQ